MHLCLTQHDYLYLRLYMQKHKKDWEEVHQTVASLLQKKKNGDIYSFLNITALYEYFLKFYSCVTFM